MSGVHHAQGKERGPWTDAHCHLADSRFEPDLDQALTRARDVGVVRWLQGGVDPGDWSRQEALAQTYGDAIALAFGLHPWWVSGASENDIESALELLARSLPRASALGELGLDKLPRHKDELPLQKRVFVAQLEIVKQTPKPLVLHVVRAHHDTLELLAEHGPYPSGGIVHAFSGRRREAERYIEHGFLLSLGGSLVSRPDRLAEYRGLELRHFVVETDAPDQMPRSWGAERNEPANLPRIAEALAGNWGVSGAEWLELAHVSLQNLLAP